jgi:hypothetical protein
MGGQNERGGDRFVLGNFLGNFCRFYMCGMMGLTCSVMRQTPVAWKYVKTLSYFRAYENLRRFPLIWWSELLPIWILQACYYEHHIILRSLQCFTITALSD